MSYILGGAGFLATVFLALFGINRKDINDNRKSINANTDCINKLDKKMIVLLTIHRLKSPSTYQKALDENGFKEIE